MAAKLDAPIQKFEFDDFSFLIDVGNRARIERASPDNYDFMLCAPTSLSPFPSLSTHPQSP
jgi:hypothetical protein